MGEECIDWVAIHIGSKRAAGYRTKLHRVGKLVNLSRSRDAANGTTLRMRAGKGVEIQRKEKDAP